MQVVTLNKAIMLLAASFPGITFNAKVYDELLGDLNDKYFLDAVYDFIKTTKEVYPGTNPLAIIREKAMSFIPSLPKPKRTNEELKKIQEMQEFYDRQKKEAAGIVSDLSVGKDLKSVKKPIMGKSREECFKILKERGEI